jgi:NADH-quinone oxidoreductase chain G
MVNVTIDEKQVTVEEGTTILTAAEKLGIEIPTFCYHDKLEAVGACRMCLVEVEKMWKLQVACATPVTEGMVVMTDTPKVKSARKGVLEFLLINHPLDCPVCDEGGECELQNLVFKYGSDRSRYVEEKRRFVVDPQAKYDDLTVGPQIVRNMNRCILCRKCVRFIHQIAGETDLGTFGRASKSEINVLPDIPVDNPYSGNVVEICPVGALTSKSFRYRTRVWQLKQTPSVCSLCGDGCNINVWSKEDQIYRITSRRNDFVDEGFLCDKGRFGFEFVNHPERLKHPLIRKDGELQPADWDEAIELVSSKLKAAKERFGPDSVYGVGSSKLTNEDNYVLQKFFRTVLGTNNIDCRVNSKSLLPSLDSNGKPLGMENTIEDIERANLIFVFGCDLEVEHPIINLRVVKSVRKGNALVVANPERSHLARFAKDELIYEKGKDTAFLDAVVQKLNGKSEQTAGAAGIAQEEVKRLAETLKEAESVLILCGRQMVEHPDNLQLLERLRDLLRSSGHQGKDVCGVNLLWRDCNSQGAMDCGVLPDRLPGHVALSDQGAVDRIEQVWKAKVPSKPGFDFNGMLDAAAKGYVIAVYVAGADPMSEYPDGKQIKEALEKLSFLVVQDVLLTETAKLAHVVLPGISFAEKDGTFTNVERRVQKLTKAFDPLAGCKADWDIICKLAQAMGHDFDYASPAEVFEELSRVSPVHSGMNWSDLDESGRGWQIS